MRWDLKVVRAIGDDRIGIGRLLIEADVPRQ